MDALGAMISADASSSSSVCKTFNFGEEEITVIEPEEVTRNIVMFASFTALMLPPIISPPSNTTLLAVTAYLVVLA